MRNIRITFYTLLFIGLFVFGSCKKSGTDNEVSQEKESYVIMKKSIQKHILFLASDEMKGRATGSPEMQQVADYIINAYKDAGLVPIDSSFVQPFEAWPRFIRAESPEKVEANNIIGLLEGADSLLKKEYIILGAHYDHLGMARDTNAVCNGADDNASGVAVVLEVAKKLHSIRDSLKRSILFITFDAEEQGLLGSSYFVSHPTVPVDRIKLMMNLDMMGRIASGDSLAVSGGGSFRGGTELLDLFTDTTSVHLYTTDKYLFASDHAPFFRNRIPVICPLPKLHPDYHSYRDDEHLIDYDGAGSMCEYTFHVLRMVANLDSIVTTVDDPKRSSDGMSIIFGRK